MGVLRKIKGQEFESYLVWTPLPRAKRIQKAIKQTYGNQIKTRIIKSPRHSGYDLFTLPDERDWHKLKRRR